MTQARTLVVLLGIQLALLASLVTRPAVAADFDNDGLADLAVGVFGESIGAAYLTGAVNVLYGSADGIAAAGNQLWYQDSPGVGGTPQPEDRFGCALATIPPSAVVFLDGFESGNTSRW